VALAGRIPGLRPNAWWAVTGALLLTVVIVVAVGWLFVARLRPPSGFVPAPSDYVGDSGLTPVPASAPTNRPGASTGSWTVNCGRNENGHRNADNLVAQPGVAGGAMHLHDYVGNRATNAFSTDAVLQRAGTTCAAGDRSTYFWPVLRVFGSGSGLPSAPVMGNAGRILRPDSVLVQYRGSPSGPVLPAPSLLRASTGNARGFSQKGLNTGHVRWGCSGLPGLFTRHYPKCPAGQRLTRTADFPNCWDGRRIDSPNHRAHLVFPDASGICPTDTFAVPQLHIVLTYTVPRGVDFAIDTMPTERRSAETDHFDYIEVMPDSLVRRVVSCINTGRVCAAT
jgi:Domain of unknown function (DUF1996)